MEINKITDAEFKLFSDIVYREVGIFLSDSKKTLVESRLTSRMLKYNLKSYSQYFRIIQMNRNEKIEMMNSITTNETYFFREEAHFKFLKETVVNEAKPLRTYRVLSGASSIGAEAYSIAMILNNYCAKWEVVGTDINSDVVKKARMGLYPLSFADKIPEKYLKKYCLKGSGSHSNQFIINKGILNEVQFHEANLLNYPRNFGMFDIIFLRNVLLYFDEATKKRVIDNVCRNLNQGGYFIISLTENLLNIDVPYLERIGNSVFRKI